MNAEIFALAGPVRGRIMISVMIDVMLTMCHVAGGVFIAFWLNAVFNGERANSVIMWLLAFAAAAVFRGVLAWASESSAQATAQASKYYLRELLLTKLNRLGPGYVMARPTGELQTIIVNGVEILEGHFSRFLPAVMSGAVGCIAVLVIIGLNDWLTALLLLLFLVAQPLIDQAWMRRRMPKLSGIFAATVSFGAYLLDNLQGLSTLKIFDATGRRRSELVRRARVLRQEAMPKISVTMARIAITGLLTFGGVATLIVVNSWRYAAGSISSLTLLLTVFLAREVFRPLERLEKEFHAFQAAKGAIKPIKGLLDAKLIVGEAMNPAPLPDSTTISFEDVTFAYPSGDRPVLENVSFSVPQGKMVALVGPSGAGKSTILSLLLRFFEPQCGAIRIGGTDISDLSLEDLRSLVTVVSQDVQLFHGTIADNLRIARPSASDADLREVAGIAHIAEFIDSLPNGYETDVGERGARLSGGERQRIAIARALLKDAPILLFDEATSNVDVVNERAIQLSIEALAGHRTMIVVAHRLATVEKADLIIVMDEGGVVEQGSHGALLRVGGLYSRLVAGEGTPA